MVIPRCLFRILMIERKQGLQGENTGAFYRDGAAEQRTQQEKLRRHRRAPHTPRRKRVPVGAGRQRLVPLAPPITACGRLINLSNVTKRHHIITSSKRRAHTSMNPSTLQILCTGPYTLIESHVPAHNPVGKLTRSAPISLETRNSLRRVSVCVKASRIRSSRSGSLAAATLAKGVSFV